MHGMAMAMAMRLRVGPVNSSLLVWPSGLQLLSKPNSIHLTQRRSITQFSCVLSKSTNTSDSTGPTASSHIDLTGIKELFNDGRLYWDKWASELADQDFSAETIDYYLKPIKVNALTSYTHHKEYCSKVLEHLGKISAFRKDLLRFQDILVEKSDRVRKPCCPTSTTPTSATTTTNTVSPLRKLYCIEWNVNRLPPAPNNHLYNTALDQLLNHSAFTSHMANWEHTMDVRVQQSLQSLRTQLIHNMEASWEQCGTPDFETQHHSIRDAVVTSGSAALASHMRVYSGRPSGNPLDEHLKLVKQVVDRLNAKNTQDSVLAMRTLREQRQIELGVETYEQQNFAEYIQAVKKEFIRDRNDHFNNDGIVERLETWTKQELRLLDERIRMTSYELAEMPNTAQDADIKRLSHQDDLRRRLRLSHQNYVQDEKSAFLKHLDTVYSMREDDWIKMIREEYDTWRQQWSCKPATKLPETLQHWTKLVEVDQGHGIADRQDAALEALMAHRDWKEAATGRATWRGYLVTAIGLILSIVASLFGIVFAWRRSQVVMDHTSGKLGDWKTSHTILDCFGGAINIALFAKLTPDERQPILTNLFALLDDDDARVRASALAAVGALTLEERAPQITKVVKIMLEDTTATTRAVAVRVFGSLTHDERHPHMDKFAPLLDDPQSVIRDEAAAANRNFDGNQPPLNPDEEISREAPRRRPLWECLRTMAVGEFTYEALKRTAESYESLTPEERVVVVASGAVAGSVTAVVAGGVAVLYLFR